MSFNVETKVLYTEIPKENPWESCFDERKKNLIVPQDLASGQSFWPASHKKDRYEEFSTGHFARQVDIIYLEGSYTSLMVWLLFDIINRGPVLVTWHSSPLKHRICICKVI